MLSFSQFAIQEDLERGWLRTGKKPYSSKAFMADHDNMAKKLRFKKGTADALNSGHVRYWHQHKGDTSLTGKPYEKSELGYEFHDHPAQRKLVRNHLAKSGGAPKIMMDIHNPVTKQSSSHEFKSVEDAHKHLDALDTGHHPPGIDHTARAAAFWAR